MEKEDEEFSMDLGKIRDFFKKKPEKHEEEKEEKEKKPETETKEEDVKIDLKKTGAFLKGIIRGQGTGIKNIEFISKHKKIIAILIPLVIVIFLSVQIRMIPASAPYTQVWAEQSVNKMIQDDIATAINQQYPNLPDENKNALVSGEFQNTIKNDKYTIKTGQYAGQSISIAEQIKTTSAYFRSFYEYDSGPEQGKLYMPDIDPYYWYRYAENIIEHGHPGDEIRDDNPKDNITNEVPWDNHQFAPNGRPIVQADRFHPYFLAYFYKALHTFNSGITLLRSTFYYPVFISALTVLFIFFIARRIAGNIAGFFAAATAAVNAAFINRTLFGHADSDAWVIFFPVLITWLFLEAFYAKKLKQISIAGAAGFFTGMFSIVWGGWWYIFDFLMGALVACLVFYTAVNFRELKINIKEYIKKSSIKNIIKVSIAYYAFTGIFITFFVNIKEFYNAPFAFLSFTTVKTPVLETLWPNVLTTVAEFNEGSINSILNSVGGIILFWIAVLGLMLLLTKRTLKDIVFLGISALWWAVILSFFRSSGIMTFIALFALPIILKLVLLITKGDKDIEVKHALLMMVWIIGTMYASTKGIRFSLLMVPAFSIALGAAFGITHQFLTKWIERELQINKAIISVVVILLLFIPLITPYNQSKTQAGYDVPIISDEWYNSLIAIKEDSKENAIITSWWDFGHHFKAIADRPVTFDGTTQVTPQAHWVGRILSTPDEEEAIGILRMLDCGGNNAFEELYSTNNDTHKSVDTLYSIFRLGKTKAGAELKKSGLTNEQTEKMLNYTHCEPPEAYFITSEDMVGKAGVWAHFGLWDFEKAEMWQKLKNKKEKEAVEYMQKRFNYTEEKATSYYYEIQGLTTESDANMWVSPWPGYLSGYSDCSNEGKEISCPQTIQAGNRNVLVNIKIDPETMNAYIPELNSAPPNKIAYAAKDGVFGKTFGGQTAGFGLMLLPRGENSYTSLMESSELADSMFSKLFFFDGHGLKYFEPFSKKRTVTGINIYVWKIDWRGKEKNEVYFVEKTTVNPGDQATVAYIGYLENSTVFDSNIKDWEEENITDETSLEGKEYNELTFTTGKYEMIAGFERGIIGMKLNETKTFTVKPEEGYGGIKQHPLANETLSFKVKVLKIK